MKPFYKIAILLFILSSCQSSDENIYDYYQSLPESFFYDANLGDIKYSIKQNEGLWICKSLAGYDIEPIVDIKNGYIEINDEGTGGGNIRTKVVLFRKAEGMPLIGITIGGFNGIYFESTTSFYESKNNSWVKSEDIFPEAGIGRFLNKSFRRKYFEEDNSITPNLTSLVELPQFGTVVHLNLNFTKYDFLVEANHSPHTQKTFNKKEQDKLWEIIENISVESFQLKFNKALGKFEITDSTLVKARLENETISDEKYILNQVWQLKEIKSLASYIKSESNGSRQLELSFDGEVENKPNYVLVHAIEDNGGNWVTHLIFHVQKNGSEIYQYDTIKDDFIKIDK